MMGEDNDNIDESGNANDIDASTDNMNADGSEVHVGGDIYDVDATDTNDVTIDHAENTANTANAGVGSNSNIDDTTGANNSDTDDNTKDSNNVGMGEVPVLLMIMTPILLMLDLKPKTV